MVEPLRHRQTKEAETDMFSLQPPRHIPTLPKTEVVLLERHARSTPKTRHRQATPTCPFRANTGLTHRSNSHAIRSLHRRVQAASAAERKSTIYCALFLVSWVFCSSSFSPVAFSGTSLTVSLSSLPVNRYGGW